MYVSGNKTILISQPNAIGYPHPFFPYMWAILKSHWEHYGAEDSYYEWLEPIFLRDDPATLLKPHQGAKIDVLGLSCYTWNWELQCAIAQQVKADNPNCLVIAGGPEPDYKDLDFFRKHPEIDAVAVKDGEITFNKILSKLMHDDRDFRDIGGLYLPGTDGNGHVYTGRAEVPLAFDYSPYIDQSAYYERLLERHGPGYFDATWETTRGCPYSCSFCDWGSSTMSKVRRFDMQRVEAEVDWLGRMGVFYIMSADANFGILPRDPDIADLMNESREKYGYPKHLYYSPAKNNPDRAVEIAKKFAKTGLCLTHTLAIQHTNDKVLAATDRRNIPAERQVQVARALIESDIPIGVQLIIGIPGDTYELWKSCLADLMEWGIHEDYDQVFFYHLLPNAPAADKAFRDEWEIETIDRCVPGDANVPWKKGDTDFVTMPKSQLIVGSKTYSRRDWVEMNTYTAFIKALHNSSLTRLISVYLRSTHDVPYLEFYERLIEDLFVRTDPAQAWYETISSHYVNFLEHDDTFDRLEVEQLPRFPFILDPARWLHVQVCLHLDAFFDELKPYLLKKYPGATHLASVIDYQKQLVILPSYDRQAGKTFPTDCHWPRYFEEARGRIVSGKRDEPDPMPGAVVEVMDQTCGEKNYMIYPLEWGSGDEEDRWIEWINATVLHRNSAAKKNFQQLRLRPPGRPLASDTNAALAPSGRPE